MSEAQMNDDDVSLDSLGLTFGTDKSSWHHNYLDFYEYHFSRLRDKPIKLLEIGVAGGTSLRVWEAYFPNATIIGADIDPETTKLAGGRVQIETVDQSSEDELTALGTRLGPFDIVIDDGSHQWDHQITSLKSLLPFLNDNGIYIVEDLQTSFSALSSHFRGEAGVRPVDYLKRLAELRIAGDFAEPEQGDDVFLLKYGSKISSVTFHKQCCLIQNGEKPRGDVPIVPVPPDALDVLTFEAHISGYGDRPAASGVINGRGHDQNIQAFSIRCRELPPDEFGYRAQLQSGEWTDWARSGEFVGTKGLSQDLIGFAVRLTGQSQLEYDVEVIGNFRALGGHVVVGNEENCVSSVMNDSLWGMQVIMRKNWAYYRPRPSR